MNLLLIHKFERIVHSPPSEVTEKLKAHVGPKDFWKNFCEPIEKPFRGDVSTSAFQIARTISHRNSFAPFLHGKIMPHPQGTKVAVTMTLHPFVIVFLCLWFLGILPIFSLGLTGELSLVNLLALLAMTAFMLLLTYAGFWLEVKKSQEAFFDIFLKFSSVRNIHSSGFHTVMHYNKEENAHDRKNPNAYGAS